MNGKALWLSLLFLVSLKGWVQSLTLTDLITQTRIFLRDTASDSARQRFSDTQITDFINNGQRELNLKVWGVINSSAITLVSGTTEYSLPSDHIFVLRVTVEHRPIVERTFSFLDESDFSWIKSTGAVQNYYVRVDSSIVAGVSKESIGFNPISSGTAIAVIQYLAQPTNLSAGSDLPFSGNNRLVPFHQALSYYGAYRGHLAQRDLELAGVYLREYENLSILMESVNKTRLMFNPNYRGQMLVSPIGGGQQQQQP